MRQALAVLLTLLAVPVSVSAQVHDCRIHALDIKATRHGDTLFLRAIYRGYDGAALSQSLCPDQNGPTWGTDREVTFRDAYGFLASVQAVPGELVVVDIATVQAPDKSFYRKKSFRF